MKKRKLKAILSLLLVISLLTACTAQKQADGGAQPGEEAAGDMQEGSNDSQVTDASEALIFTFNF